LSADADERFDLPEPAGPRDRNGDDPAVRRRDGPYRARDVRSVAFAIARRVAPEVQKAIVRITAAGRLGLGAGIVPRAALGNKSAKLGASGKHNSFEQRAGMPVPDERVAEVV